MSATAIRFAPRNRAQRGVRTGMLAYQGIASRVQAEAQAQAEAERIRAEELFCWAQIEKPVAATLLGGGLYQKHYGAHVKVTYRTRKHTILTAAY